MAFKSKIVEREYNRTWAKNNKEKMKASRHRYWKKHPEKYIYLRAFHRSRQAGIKFSLKLEDFTIPSKCPCCKKVFGDVLENRSKQSPSLDRIDSSKGYTKQNVAVLCWGCNKVKTNGTIEQFKQLVKWLSQKRSRS
jgi:hypothetical protein